MIILARYNNRSVLKRFNMIGRVTRFICVLCLFLAIKVSLKNNSLLLLISEKLLAIAGNAQILATNNLRDFVGSELAFPQLQILNPYQIIRS
jgi:hypothetical protein